MKIMWCGTASLLLESGGTRLLIDCLVKEILLYDDKIEIYFNSPIKPSPAEGGPDESRGFLFYTEDIRIAFKDPHRSELTRIEVQFEMRL